MNKKLAWSGASSLAVIAGLFLLSPIFTTYLCACAPMIANMESAFGASPLYEPEAFRQRFLEKVPTKTTQEQLFNIVGSISGGHAHPDRRHQDARVDAEYIERMNRRCVKVSDNTECSFLVGKKWFGFNEIGFRMKFLKLGPTGYDDVAVSTYSNWF